MVSEDEKKKERGKHCPQTTSDDVIVVVFPIEHGGLDSSVAMLAHVCLVCQSLARTEPELDQFWPQSGSESAPVILS